MDSESVASAGSRRQVNSLQLRWMSAIVALPVIIAIIWWGVWPVAAAVAVVLVLCLRELIAAFVSGGYHVRQSVVYTTGLLLLAAALPTPLRSSEAILAVISLSLVGGLIAELRFANRPGALAEWALGLAGAYYVAGLLLHLVLLRELVTPLLPGWARDVGMAPGAAWVLFVLATTWLQDTGAYFAGRSFGRTKLAPTLSPQKTWEGAVGGMIGAVAGALVAWAVCGLPIGVVETVLLGVVAGVVGPLGDLAESMIKRQAKIKDASDLIPGHGGLLDRLDSVMFTAPVLYYLIVVAVRFT